MIKLPKEINCHGRIVSKTRRVQSVPIKMQSNFTRVTSVK